MKWSRDWLAEHAVKVNAADPSRAMTEIKLVPEFEKVARWLEKRRVTLEFIRIKGAEWDSWTKRIVVSDQMKVEHQLYCTLHEIGHMLLEKGKHEVIARNTYYPASQRNVQRVDILEEELMAWRRGEALAKRLKLRIDYDEYNRYRARMVRTYMKWGI